MTRDGRIRKGRKASLDRLFGTDGWYDAFYHTAQQLSMLGDEERAVKSADFQVMADYFVGRLKEVFAKVAENPLPLMSSKNVPLYLLCFASANPRGADVAVKIAQEILGKA